VPATVSLLCICIAFVPMFGLGGVAGYLFPAARRSGDAGALRPPMCCRVRWCRRWRTISCVINTFTARLRSVTPRPAAIRLHASSMVSSMCFENVRKNLSGACLATLSAQPDQGDRRIPGFQHPVVRSCAPISARTSSRPWMAAQIKLHIRAPTGNADRGDDEPDRPDWARPFTASFRPTNSAASSAISGSRSAASTWPTTIPAPSGSADADIPDQPQAQPCAERRLHQDNAGGTAAAVSRAPASPSFRLISSARFLNFGVAGADRRCRSPAATLAADRKICQCTADEKSGRSRGSAGRAYPAGVFSSRPSTSMSTAR